MADMAQQQPAQESFQQRLDARGIGQRVSPRARHIRVMLDPEGIEHLEEFGKCERDGCIEVQSNA